MDDSMNPTDSFTIRSEDKVAPYQDGEQSLLFDVPVEQVQEYLEQVSSSNTYLLDEDELFKSFEGLTLSEDDEIFEHTQITPEDTKLDETDIASPTSAPSSHQNLETQSTSSSSGNTRGRPK